MIWFLFFFATFTGLALLFIIGTNAGVSQKVSSENACDPYVTLPLKVKKDSCVPVKPKKFDHWAGFGGWALAEGDIVQANIYFSMSDSI